MLVQLTCADTVTLSNTLTVTGGVVLTGGTNTDLWLQPTSSRLVLGSTASTANFVMSRPAIGGRAAADTFLLGQDQQTVATAAGSVLRLWTVACSLIFCAC